MICSRCNKPNQITKGNICTPCITVLIIANNTELKSNPWTIVKPTRFQQITIKNGDIISENQCKHQDISHLLLQENNKQYKIFKCNTCKYLYGVMNDL